MIFDDESMDVQRYINEVLPIARQSDKRMLGNDWTYQQNGARPHIHHLSQKNGVLIIFLDLFLKIGGLLNHLIYVHWIKVYGMNSKKITTKTPLIKEIKHSVKENILNSVHDFTKRLRLFIKKKKKKKKEKKNGRRIYSLNKIYPILCRISNIIIFL